MPQKLLFTLITFCLVSYSVQAANLYDQLCQLNKQWLEIQPSESFYFEEVKFEDREDLIKVHLLLVEKYLRENVPTDLDEMQFKQRSNGLDILNEYWKTGAFPQNKLHENSMPYFIDDENTACAVGHIMRESGNLQLAEQISRESNYAYIEEMNFEALPLWATEMGFSLFELKWIQPSYGSSFALMNDTIVAPSSCDESDGMIYVQSINTTQFWYKINCLDFDLWLEIAEANEWPFYEEWSQLEDLESLYYNLIGSTEVWPLSYLWLPVLDSLYSVNNPLSDCNIYEGDIYIPTLSAEFNYETVWSDIQRNVIGNSSTITDLDAGVYHLNINADSLYDIYIDLWLEIGVPYNKTYLLNDSNGPAPVQINQLSTYCDFFVREFPNGTTAFLTDSTGYVSMELIPEEGNEIAEVNWYNYEGDYLGSGLTIDELPGSQNLANSYVPSILTNYYLELIDEDDCKTYQEFTAYGGTQYFLNKQVQHPSGPDSNDGSIYLYIEDIENHINYYSEYDLEFVWDDGYTTGYSTSRENLGPGIYNVTMTNSYGCSFSLEFILGEEFLEDCFEMEAVAICDHDTYEVLISLAGEPETEYSIDFNEPFDSTYSIVSDSLGFASFVSLPQANLTGYEAIITNGLCVDTAMNQMIDCSSGLSIKLLDFYFTQSKDITELVWETASEQAGDYFILEYSLNGTGFQEFYKERVEESSNVKQQHNAFHAPENCKIFYRLKMLDGQSGKVNFSKVIAINNCSNSEWLSEVSLYPNPASDHFILEFFTDTNIDTESEMSLEIIDLQGRKLQSKQLELTEVKNSIELDVSDLSVGLFFVKLIQDGEIHLTKLMIER